MYKKTQHSVEYDSLSLYDLTLNVKSSNSNQNDSETDIIFLRLYIEEYLQNELKEFKKSSSPSLNYAEYKFEHQSKPQLLNEELANKRL